MRFLDSAELEEKVPYSRVHIWRLERAGLFPKRIKIGPGRVAWDEDEVDEWLREKLRQRDADA